MMFGWNKILGSAIILFSVFTCVLAVLQYDSPFIIVYFVPGFVGCILFMWVHPCEHYNSIEVDGYKDVMGIPVKEEEE